MLGSFPCSLSEFGTIRERLLFYEGGMVVADMHNVASVTVSCMSFCSPARHCCDVWTGAPRLRGARTFSG